MPVLKIKIIIWTKDVGWNYSDKLTMELIPIQPVVISDSHHQESKELKIHT